MIKLLINDVAGIMTTGMKYYTREGEVKLKTFCDKDWTSIKRFRAAGVHVVFLTGDGYNKKILENRNLHVIVNRGCGFHSDQANYLDEILEEYESTAEDTGFIGDDLFDIGIMRKVEYPFCVLNSPKMVKDNASCLKYNGGDNVLMHLFEVLEETKLIPTVSYEDVVDKIYDLDIKEKF